VTIYCLHEPRGSQVAQIDIHSTKRRLDDREELCPKCGAPPALEFGPPFSLEWLPGSDVLADFLWTQGGGGSPVLQLTVAEILARRFRGFEPAEVQMVEKPLLKRPACLSKRTRPRIWLPYEGPALRFLRVTTTVHLDENRSTGHFHRDCTVCGSRCFTPEGIEEHTVQYGPYRPGAELPDVAVDRPRRAGAGLFVRFCDLEGASVFSTHEWGGTLCTKPFRDFVVSSRYSNIEFWEYGEAL